MLRLRVQLTVKVKEQELLAKQIGANLGQFSGRVSKQKDQALSLLWRAPCQAA